ncbi:lipocalin-like domain-containing protein [Flavobacterium solisilvae]|uniref:Lipocalin family protein n=1 Tax=Flavobacterium solisilvae TaxID=1852019 RepID=A0ABX1QY17_9FLAO|nr:lipocalin family protein [Flavobacterium solisilvae]NMH25719.1 lipocalin family protein [Flavobacterium solisilvae]
MKVLKLSAVIATSILVFSCSSDDGPSTSGELTGKWYNKEYKVAGQTIPYDDHEECGKDYIQFNSNGTGRSVDVWDCEEDSENFTYTKTSNSITITMGGESATAQIVELSSSTLRVKVNYDFDGDGDDESVIEVYTRS